MIHSRLAGGCWDLLLIDNLHDIRPIPGMYKQAAQELKAINSSHLYKYIHNMKVPEKSRRREH